MPEQASPAGAVFLSYASQDTKAATRICEALREAGIDVWFDQSELRGGDSWDAQIKKHVHECALFVPVISAHTNARSEGYFRREWNLGIRRLLDMAQDVPFLVPVVIDATREADARVPEEFLSSQWTRLPGGDTPPAFIQRVRQLMSVERASVRSSHSAVTGRIVPGSSSSLSLRGRHRVWGIGLGLLALLLILGGGAYWHYQGTSEPPAATFSPPPHSVAVLAFTNMSGDAEEEYFSDGLSEEILQSLAQIAEFKVAARTSSFSFKGSNVDIPTVGRRLNVGTVLEGSVRKAGDRVRVTAQLVNAVTGFHIWSENFDYEFKDVIALQSEIALAVASALEVRLFADAKKVRSPGGTSNARALDAFMRGRAGNRIQDEKNLRLALVALNEAVALDPSYANAHALRGDVLAQLLGFSQDDPAEMQRVSAEALQAVKRAVEIAPDSSFAYEALGQVLLRTTSDYVATDAAFLRSMQLAPGSAYALKGYAQFAILMGRADALPAIERALELDPLNPSILANLGYVQLYSRKYGEARKSLQRAMQGWENQATPGLAALNELASGNPAAALPYYERDVADWNSQSALAIAYHRLGRHKDAEAMLRRLQDENGDDCAFQYAEIYAQWGRPAEGMRWLEKAARLKDPGLMMIKVDPFLDPLRKMDGFQDIVAGLHFPP